MNDRKMKSGKIHRLDSGILSVFVIGLLILLSTSLNLYVSTASDDDSEFVFRELNDVPNSNKQFVMDQSVFTVPSAEKTGTIFLSVSGNTISQFPIYKDSASNAQFRAPPPVLVLLA